MAEWCDEHKCDQTECYVLHLEAENSRLRKALEEAPECPPLLQTSFGRNYADWYNGLRAEALKEEV